MDTWTQRRVEGKSLGDFWLSLYRRKWVLLLTLAASVGTGYVVSNRLPAVYETRGVFYVPARPSALTFYSPDALKTVVPVPKEPVPKEDAQAIYLGFLKSDTLRNRVHQLVPEKSTEALHRDVDFKVSNEFTLQVFSRDRNPQLAAKVADAYIDAFEAEVQETAHGATDASVLAAIGGQIDQAAAQLARAREAVRKFEERHKIPSFSDYVAQVNKERADTQRFLETARISLREQNQRLAGLQEQLVREGSTYTPKELIVTSPLAEALRRDLADLEASLAGTRTSLREKHPEVQRLEAQVADKRQQLAQEIDRIVRAQTKPAGSFYESLRQSLITALVDKGVLETRIQGNERLLRQIEERVQDIPALREQHDALSNEVKRLQSLLDSSRLQLAEAKAQQQSHQRISVVVDQARPPEEPSFPSLWLNLLVAGILGVVGGVYYCTLLDYAQRVRERRRLDPYRIAGRLLQARREGRA